MLTGDFGRLRQVQRAVADLGRSGGAGQRGIALGVIREVKAVLKEQHAHGVGPDGSWQRTKRGRPALLSRRLPSAWKGEPVDAGARFSSKISWLGVHHEGHTFAARRAGGQWLRFDRKGRLITFRRFLSLASGANLGASKQDVQTFTRTDKKGRVKFVASRVRTAAHAVGRRVLPARRLFPVGAIPARWGVAINRGAEAGMRRWFERATGE